MYNKLFTKILDSSIWLAPDPHRIVWITLIAAMDEDGNAMFASAGNLAARARVTREQATSAVEAFEGPDPDSGDPENEGRRIERIPGGWHVLNAAKYRALVTKAIIREQTRQRTAKYRATHRAGDAPVTQPSRTGDAPVTPSVALAVAEALSEEERESKSLPSLWEVSPKLKTWAAAECPGIDIESETAKMRDYIFSRSFVDWDGQWKNWMRRAVAYRATQPAKPGGSATPGADESQAYLAAQDRIKVEPPNADIMRLVRGATKAAA